MRLVTAALLAVYFLFFLNHVTSQPFFTRLGSFQPTLYDLFALGFVVATYLYYRFASKRFPSDRPSRRSLFWTINVFVALGYLCVMSHLIEDQNKTPVIALTVGYFATIGWIYTNYMNLRSQQRAHTMNVLLSLRTNAVLNEHRINFHRAFPPGKRLTAADLPRLRTERADAQSYNITSSQRATSTLDSVQYMANLYEFICVGMRQGNLDESIIRMSLRGILVNYFETIQPYIEQARIDANGNLLPRVYENYLYYIERFRERA
jgi:hypothetical protein